MSRLVAFYRGEATDTEGRCLEMPARPHHEPNGGYRRVKRSNQPETSMLGRSLLISHRRCSLRGRSSPRSAPASGTPGLPRTGVARGAEVSASSCRNPTCNSSAPFDRQGPARRAAAGFLRWPAPCPSPTPKGSPRPSAPSTGRVGDGADARKRRSKGRGDAVGPAAREAGRVTGRPFYVRS